MSSAPYTLAGVLGWPVRHSRSPLMHNHWIAQYGLQGAYVLLQAAPATLADALRGLPALGFAGCNLTIPHKVAAMPLVDEVDALARRMGAINTVVVRPDGSLRGINTDGYGYLQSLLSQCPAWRADAGPAVVLGAGGGARAVVVALAEHGVREIRVCNRSPEKAESLAREFGAPVRAVPWAQREDALADAGLLVNTTSLGMVGQAPLELSLARLPAHAVVSDLVYSPLDTALLQAARAGGHAVADGLGMLMHQARPAFESWFGVLPEITPALRHKLEASL